MPGALALTTAVRAEPTAASAILGSAIATVFTSSFEVTTSARPTGIRIRSWVWAPAEATDSKLAKTSPHRTALPFLENISPPGYECRRSSRRSVCSAVRDRGCLRDAGATDDANLPVAGEHEARHAGHLVHLEAGGAHGRPHEHRETAATRRHLRRGHRLARAHEHLGGLADHGVHAREGALRHSVLGITGHAQHGAIQ